MNLKAIEADFESFSRVHTSTGGATIHDSEALLAMRAGLHNSASSSSSVVSDQNIFSPRDPSHPFPNFSKKTSAEDFSPTLSLPAYAPSTVNPKTRPRDDPPSSLSRGYFADENGKIRTTAASWRGSQAVD